MHLNESMVYACVCVMSGIISILPGRDSSSSERLPCEVHLPAPLWRLSFVSYPYLCGHGCTIQLATQVVYGGHYIEFKPRGWPLNSSVFSLV